MRSNLKASFLAVGQGRRALGLLAAVVGTSAVGCGSDESQLAPPASSAGASTPDAAPTPNASTPDATPVPAPLYVVSTGVVSGDDFLGYLTTVPSLEPGTTFNLDRAVEVGAGAWIFNRPGDDSVYVASLADATIVRWEVRGDGDFVRHETLDFGSLGTSSAYLAASTQIFSAGKSYFVDEDQDQLVIWNPERMELIGTLPLGDEPKGALRPIPEGALLIHGDQLVVTVGWRDADDTSALGDQVRIVTIDTKLDQIVDSSVEDRTTHAALNTVGADGTAYYSTYSLYAAYREIGVGHGAPSTLLRVEPDADRFDPEYSLDLSTLVGGRPAGDFTLLDDQTALIRAWHSDLVDPIDLADWQAVLWNESGFLWWRWHIGDAAAVQIPDQDPGALGATVFKVGDRTYSTLYAADLSSTTLVEVTPSAEFVPALEGPGQIIGAGVLRVH
jgi:hypothetical protein